MMKTGVCERVQCGFLVVEGRLWVLWSGGSSPHACDYGLARGGEAALLLSPALGDEPHLLEGLQLARPGGLGVAKAAGKLGGADARMVGEI